MVDFKDFHENEKFTRLCRAPKDDVRRFFRTTELGNDFPTYEEGLVTSLEFFGLVKEKLVFTASYEEFLALFGDMSFELKRDVFDLLFGKVKLKYGPEFWLLSNINKYHYQVINSKWPGISANCRRVFTSYELHARKPGREILDAMFETIGVDPNSRYGKEIKNTSLLIDDLEENCEMGIRYGIPSVQFRGAENLQEYLTKKCGMELDL